MTHPWLRLHPGDKTHLRVAAGDYDHVSLCGKVSVALVYKHADHFYASPPGSVCGHCRRTLTRLNTAMTASEGR